jgi:hypothetical protein
LCAALLISPEFDANPSFALVITGIHQPVLAQFTLIELIVLGLIVGFCIVNLSSLLDGVALSSRMLVAGLFGVTIIVVAVWVGMANGSTALFGDWKNLFLGFGLWFVLSKGLCNTSQGRIVLAATLVAVTAGWALWLLVDFSRGGGVTVPILGRIPVWDHPSLEFMVASGAIASWRLISTKGSPSTKGVWLLGVLLPGAVIILSFRRFAWVELVLALGIVLVLGGRRRQYRVRSLLTTGVMVVGATAAIGYGSPDKSFGERLDSLDIGAGSSTGLTYSSTNDAHLNDIRDAWDVITRHPIWGLGVGTTYTAERTADWKSTSGMVHNGPLDVWIKFGLAGVLFYAAGMAMLIRTTSRRLSEEAFAGGVFAFFVGQLAVTSTVFAWPFATLAGSILFFCCVSLVHPTTLPARQTILFVKQ